MFVRTALRTNVRSSLNLLRPFGFQLANASTLVIADHDGKTLRPATLSAVTAAGKIGGDVTILVAGKDCKAAAAAAGKVAGVKSVLCCQHACLEGFLAENLSPVVKNCVEKKGFSHVIAPATAMGKNVTPRIAALLDVQPLSEVISVDAEDTFTRPIYAGNALLKVKSKDKVKVMTVRPTSFAKAAETGSAAVEDFAGDAKDTGLTQFKGQEIIKSDRPDLTAARVVVSGGRAMKSADNFKILYDLADVFGGGAVGASRAAVDAGYIGNDLQVGQTGKVVAPELYFAIGISGAIQHLAGMKDSKTIVAINKDPEAPIFQVADIGLVADLFTAVPEITKALKK